MITLRLICDDGYCDIEADPHEVIFLVHKFIPREATFGFIDDDNNVHEKPIEKIEIVSVGDTQI